MATAFPDMMIDTPRKRPSLIDALAAAHSNPASGGISVRGVGDNISADVPDDDPYAQNLDVQSTAPGMSRGGAASSFLSGRLSEIAGNYDRNEMDEATKVQRLKNAASLEAERGKAAIYNDPVIRKMQNEQFDRQMQLKQLDVQSKVLPEQIRAHASTEVADRAASGKEAAATAGARVRGLQRQLEVLEKMRYDPVNGPLPTKTDPGSWSGALGGGTGHFLDRTVPNPDYVNLNSRIDSLNRQLMDEGDTGDQQEPTTDPEALRAIVQDLQRRGMLNAQPR